MASKARRNSTDNPYVPEHMAVLRATKGKWSKDLLENIDTQDPSGEDHWFWVGPRDEQSGSAWWEKEDPIKPIYRYYVGDIGDGHILYRTCGEVECMNPYHTISSPKNKYQMKGPERKLFKPWRTPGYLNSPWYTQIIQGILNKSQNPIRLEEVHESWVPPTFPSELETRPEQV